MMPCIIAPPLIGALASAAGGMNICGCLDVLNGLQPANIGKYLLQIAVGTTANI